MRDGPSAPGDRAEPLRFDPAIFQRYATVEGRHFWFRARNRVLAAMLRRLAGGLPPGGGVLEVGCGGGNVLRVLEQALPEATVFGMEPVEEGLRLARKLSPAHLVRGDIAAPPFGPSFQLVGLFDVLEHLPDEVAALENLRGILAPGGVLALTVPAHQGLWCRFDEACGHRRRYSRDSLSRSLEAAGYRIEYLTYFICATLPLLWLFRNLQGRVRNAGRDKLGSGGLRVVPGLNALLYGLLGWEAAAVGRGFRLPWGSSILAVARPAGGGAP